MKKELVIDGYFANGEVEEFDGGSCVVIRIPFSFQGSAERCLERLDTLREVSSEKAPEDIELKEGK